MEMYFGDETLNELLKHAEHVSNQISTLNEILEDDAEEDEEKEKE